MKITFHGAVRTVTGSQHLLEINGQKILLDCGLYQGKRDLAFSRNRNLPFNPAELDLVILSHAHIDHSGNLPNLVKSGFRGDILCTYATRDLCALMLRDSAKIQQYDIDYLNRKEKRRGKNRLSPLYTLQDAVACLDNFIGMSYNRPRQVLPGIWLTFYDAGHILGSAIVELAIEDREAERDVRLVFSGDLGRPNRPILRDPATVARADVLLLESTYGNRDHPPATDVNATLAEVINDTYRRGGKVIVPAFAVGRTQELVYRLHTLSEEGRIPAGILIYVDSPMAIDATGIYRLHPEAYDEEMATLMLEKNGDPFGFGRMRYTRATEQSKELNALRDTAVIISASGMAEAGRILHHLKNNAEDPNSTILITGWQAPDTLGRRIVEHQPTIRVLGNQYKLRARVEVINGLSGHADRNELLDWATHMAEPPRQTFLVHGEEASAMALAITLRSHGFPRVTVPELHESFDV